MTSSFRITIRILSRDVGYLLRVWMNSGKVVTDNNSRLICKQAIINFSLAYSFQKMFIIGQNLKHVHMTESFFELLIFC